MSKQFVLLVSIIIYLCLSCSHSSKSLIGGLIEDKCSNIDSCFVILSDITPFEWDSMTVFDINATREDVLSKLPLGSPYSIDNVFRIYFFHDGIIVHHEFEIPQWDRPLKNTVFFQMIGNYKTWTIKNSHFYVGRKKLKNGYYFILSPKE